MGVQTYSDSQLLPLEGITVLDLTQVVAGPFATMTLGDLGADIIKVEAVGRGDRCRSITPNPEYFDTVNRNKRSIAIDLSHPEGQSLVHSLAADADVVIESMKPGRPEKFNVAYEDLSAKNPELIYCSISGFGEGSPYEDVPAWDMLIQAMSGIMSMAGTEDSPPLWSGLPSGDIAAGMYATQSVLAALYARERGQIDTEWIEVPMLDAAISWLCSRAGYTFGFDEPFPRLGVEHPSIAPFGVFECADEAIVIAAGTPSLWRSFCEALGRSTLVEDDRFATPEKRLENIDQLTELIEEELASAAAEEWVEQFHRHDVPAGPIYDTKTVWSDQHVIERNLHRQMERPDRQPADVIDHPVHFSELTTQLRVAPQRIGESTADVLGSLGLTESEIATLRDEDVVQ